MQDTQISISDEIEKELEVEDITREDMTKEPKSSKTMATLKPMPERDSHRAPCYQGKLKELMVFLEEFERHAAAAELTNGEKAEWVVRYVKPKEVASFWQSLPEYKSNPKDYAKLKVAILEQYAEAKTGERYTRKELSELTAKYAHKSMKTESRLNEYNQKFRPMGIWLEEKGIISSADLDGYFWYGIPAKTQKRILN